MDDWWQRAVEVLNTPPGYVGVGTAAVVGVASAAYLLTRPTPLDLGIDYDQQGVQLKDGSYADPWSVKNGKLLEYYYDDVRTCYQGFLRGKRINGDGQCLGARTGPNREYEWISYNKVHERMQAFGSGLFQLGVQPGQKTHFGIFAQNRPEWVIADQACGMYSMVTVALYDTLGPEAVVYVVNLCDIAVLVCDTAARARTLMDNKSQMKTLSTIIMIEPLEDEERKAASQAGIKILHFSEVEKLGEGNLREAVPPVPSDICTICFTSGTTGDPKGALITHGNIIADISALVNRLSEVYNVQRDDSHLSYLPLAHMYERVNIANVLIHGGRAGFYSRDIQLLFNDIQTLKPNSFPTVPRIINKIRDKVMAGAAASKIKSYLVQCALNGKLKDVRRGIIRKDSFWDKLVFHKIQALLGGRVSYMSTGSAPLSPEVFDFARCAFGCLVFEGYGQTEATAAVTLTCPGDPTPGHVGPPLACNYVKLIDVPEMDYYAKDGIGEVCFKGTNMMVGYYRNPQKTLEAFTDDGWLKTGDVGLFLKNGTLQIVDRCKHIFKLAQGEYIAPERLEAIYTRSKYIQQCFVDGDSLKARCVAVVVPDPDFILPWAANNGKESDMKILCQDEELRGIILEDMRQIGKSAQLKGFEQVLDICLEPAPFSLESGLLTPTFKNKRPQMRKHFAHRVAAVYAKHRD